MFEHLEPPGTGPDDPGDEPERGSERNLFEIISNDRRASAILLAALSVVGGPLAARIITEYLASAHPHAGLIVTPDSGVIRASGRTRGNDLTRVRTRFESAVAAMQPEEREQLLDEARNFVLVRVLKDRPSSIWNTMPHARMLVVSLLTREPELTAGVIARTLSAYLRDHCGLPLDPEHDLPEPPFRTLIKKSGRDGYADKLRRMESTGCALVRGGDGPPLSEATITRLIEQTRTMKHVQSPLWRDTRARYIVGRLLQDDSVTVEALREIIERFLGHAISVPGIQYRIYAHPQGRRGLASTLLSDVLPGEARRELGLRVNAMRLACRTAALDNAIRRNAGEGVDEVVHRRLRSYFMKEGVTPHHASSLLRVAVLKSDELMGALSVAYRADPTIRGLVALSERTDERRRALSMEDVYAFAARRGTFNLNMSRSACDVVFILNGITRRGVLSLVRSGERPAAERRSLQDRIGTEGDATQEDLVGDDDPGFERFEARDAVEKILEQGLAAGVLSPAAIDSLRRILSGQDLETPEEYQELARAVSAVPSLRSMLGMEEEPE